MAKSGAKRLSFFGARRLLLSRFAMSVGIIYGNCAAGAGVGNLDSACSFSRRCDAPQSTGVGE
jgi:hypothetical protein